MNISNLVIWFLALCLLNILYWQVIYPVALRSVRFRLFARRDRLRRLAITNKEIHNSFAYTEAESFICKTIAVLPTLNVLSFVYFSVHHKKTANDGYARFRQEAPLDLIELMDSTVSDAIIFMSLNSPIFSFFCLLVGLYFWIAGTALLTVQRKAEDFIDALPPGGPTTQAA